MLGKRKNNGEYVEQGASSSHTAAKPNAVHTTKQFKPYNRLPCGICAKDHQPYRCPEFLALNLAGRKEAVRR